MRKGILDGMLISHRAFIPIAMFFPILFLLSLMFNRWKMSSYTFLENWQIGRHVIPA